MTTMARPELEGLERYKFGWADQDVAGQSPRAGVCPRRLSGTSRH